MKVMDIYSGKQINCRGCGAEDKWIDEGRSLDFFNYRCGGCDLTIHPYTETGASR